MLRSGGSPAYLDDMMTLPIYPAVEEIQIRQQFQKRNATTDSISS